LAEEQRTGEVAAATRAGARWRSTLLVAVPALLLVVAAVLVSMAERRLQSTEDGFVLISSAQVAVASDSGRRTEPAELPYHWDAHHPGEQGSAIFTASFELPDEPHVPWGLQIPKIGNAYEVLLNDVLVDRRGDIETHGTADYALLPRYASLGTALKRGTNRLTITIRADRGRDAGLSRMLVGPESTLRRANEYGYDWILASTATFAAISLGIGLLALALWASRPPVEGGRQGGEEALYLYAAAAQLTEAATAGTSLLSSPPLPWPWWGVVSHTALGAAICFLVMACVEIARWGQHAHARRLRRWLTGLVLIGPAMSYAALGAGAAWALSAWYAAVGVTAAAFGVVFVLHATREGSAEERLAAVAIAVNLVAGAHDLHALASGSDYLHDTTLVYASMLFDLTLGAIVILRFRTATRRARELTRTLAARVADREKELGESYRKLELLARQQERMKERASILRDMHDGVGAHLSMALRQIESGHVAREELVPPLRDALDQLKLTIDNVNLPPGDVASLMGNLRYRLGPRIEASGIRLDWKVDWLERIDRLDGQAMRQLMFVLFEAISNALQHSGASELRVEVGEADGVVGIRIVDNGAGFDVASSWERGLLTMKDRAQRIGARLEIVSVPGETRVEVRIPRSEPGVATDADGA